MEVQDVLRVLGRVEQRFPEQVTLDRFVERVESGEVQVFVVSPESVMVGQAYDDGSVLIVAAAGVLNELLEFEPKFCEFYREHGYKSVRMCGRRGWAKYLPALGYHSGDYDTEMRKELSR